MLRVIELSMYIFYCLTTILLFCFLNSCTTLNNSIFLSNELISKGEHKTYISHTIGSSYFLPSINDSNIFTPRMKFENLKISNFPIQSYLFSSDIRFGVHKRIELSTGISAAFIAPLPSFKIRIGSTLLLIDNTTKKLGLNFQTSVLAGVLNALAPVKIVRSYYGYDVDLGLNQSFLINSNELCIVPRLRFTQLYGNKEYDFYIGTLKNTNESVIMWENFNYEKDAENIRKYRIKIQDNSLQIVNFGCSLAFNLLAKDRSFDIGVLFDNQYYFRYPNISLGFRSRIN
jgi:hypothetical protein